MELKKKKKRLLKSIPGLQNSAERSWRCFLNMIGYRAACLSLKTGLSVFCYLLLTHWVCHDKSCTYFVQSWQYHVSWTQRQRFFFKWRRKVRFTNNLGLTFQKGQAHSLGMEAAQNQIDSSGDWWSVLRKIRPNLSQSLIITLGA